MCNYMSSHLPCLICEYMLNFKLFNEGLIFKNPLKSDIFKNLHTVPQN